MCSALVECGTIGGTDGAAGSKGGAGQVAGILMPGRGPGKGMGCKPYLYLYKHSKHLPLQLSSSILIPISMLPLVLGKLGIFGFDCVDQSLFHSRL